MQSSKRFFIFSLIVLYAVFSSFAQEILTADNFFAKVSAKYSTITDYEADVKATADKQTMSGTVSFKNPNLMRMDFTDPATQVILFDGKVLTVYVPSLRAILTQDTNTGASVAASLTSHGLRMMSRSYSMAYESGPTASPLHDAENEQVIRLVLTRRTVSEGFRRIILSVNPETLLIRRIEGVTLAGDFISYDFTNIRLNQGIPDARFLYDTPSGANEYPNFLFSTGE